MKVITLFQGGDNEVHVGLDVLNLDSDLYKLVYCYLRKFHDGDNLDDFKYKGIANRKISPEAFMKVILKK